MNTIEFGRGVVRVIGADDTLIVGGGTAGSVLLESVRLEKEIKQ